MIRILSISGSPVQNSSTDILLDRISRSIVAALGTSVPADVSFVKLNSISFRGCQACGVDPTPRWCFYDDLGDVLDRLARCDCLLFGSPIYFDSVSGQSKMFIDRTNCFRPPEYGDDDEDSGFIRRLQRTRPGAMVLVGGERQWMEGARKVVAGFFKWVEITNEGMLTYSSPSMSRKGTVAEDVETLARADELGKHLATQLLQQLDGKNK